MATFSFGNVPSPIQQALRLAQLREIQNPQLALDRDIQKAIQLQQLQQQSPENQLALQLRQAQLNSQLADQAFEQQRQPLILEQIKAQLDPNYKAQQNAQQLAFDVDKARQLAQVAQEFTPVVTPKNSVLSPGQRLVDPEGKEITSVPTTDRASRNITVSPGSKVIDFEGNVIFDNPPIAKTSETTPVLNPVSGDILGFMVNGKFESNKKLGTGTTSTSEAGVEYARDASNRILASVTDLRPRVSRATVGLGSLSSMIPESPARDFEADLKKLKSGIFVQTLQAMRNASKTGGAVGQVSNKEGDRFENALGALDQAQSPENFKKNLDIIEDSTKKFLEALNKQGTTGPAATGAPAPLKINSIRLKPK